MGHATAQRNNSTYAIKLVRGAYMDEEGRLAQEQGYESMCIYVSCVIYIIRVHVSIKGIVTKTCHDRMCK